MSLKIDEPGGKPENVYVLFASGFRPFFLLSGFTAVALILIWLLHFAGHSTLISYYSPIGWHAHEMLFGYAVAVIAGFLLTAAGNWTGLNVICGGRLMLLSAVWLMGRVFPLIAELPHWLVAITDLVFIPLVALILGFPIVRAKQWANFIFVPILLLMAVANLIVHLSVMKLTSLSPVIGSQIMLYLVVLLIVVMGGRVIPFFTERGVVGITIRRWIWIERLAPASMVLLALTDLIYGNRIITVGFAVLSVLVHMIRLIGWYSNKIWKVPLVWVLQLAYAWIIAGFILKSYSLHYQNAAMLSYHALTVGGIAIMTMGMMARVSLGHTGRSMQVSRNIIWAFVLLNLAALFRVLLPIFLPEYYSQLLNIAGWFWVAAFILFIVVYTPILMRPRIDGREG